MGSDDGAIFFESHAAWGDWLGEHGASRDELWVGFWKRGIGQPTLTWEESVDEALCHGWIDGIRRSVDDRRYKIRFTPRRARSSWSTKNLNRVEELIAAGRMQPAGLAVFDAREVESANSSVDRSDPGELPPEYQQEFEASPSALAFFEALPPGYRRLSILWVLDAKREETRLRRLRVLIEDSANGLRIKPLRR